MRRLRYSDLIAYLQAAQPNGDPPATIEHEGDRTTIIIDEALAEWPDYTVESYQYKYINSLATGG